MTERERERDGKKESFFFYIMEEKKTCSLLFARIYCHIPSYRCHHHFLVVSTLFECILVAAFYRIK